MTDEELKEEAEDYANRTRIKDKNTYVSFDNECISELQDYEGNYMNISERIIKTYIDSAEPREKRIAELEKENAELKNQLSDVYECFISASSGDDFEMAESAREVMEVLNMQCYRHGEVKSKLTKAKEIIKQYLYCYSQKELPSKLQIEAEQFLKECE